jgi:hypothetical protein
MIYLLFQCDDVSQLTERATFIFALIPATHARAWLWVLYYLAQLSWRHAFIGDATPVPAVAPIELAVLLEAGDVMPSNGSIELLHGLPSSLTAAGLPRRST